MRPRFAASSTYAAHGGFVWITLQRFGVREEDLEDLFQEVFVVVQHRLPSFEERSQMTTWLFGICLRVVAAHRRRAYVRRERAVELPIAETVCDESDPEQALEASRKREALEAILDSMDLEKRAVFVMAVIEEMPADQIASLMGVPIGTVYSRLHAAKKEFDRAAVRWKARHATRGAR